MNLLDIVLQYYKSGYCPIPVNKDKSTDIAWEAFLTSLPEGTEQVKTRFQLSNTSCYIALVVSKLYGFLVLEVDSSEDIEKIKKKYSIPETVSYRMGNNGICFFFKYPPELTEFKVPTGIFEEKMEIRNKHLVIVPPAEGQWINSIFTEELAELPSALLEVAKHYQKEEEKTLDRFQKVPGKPVQEKEKKKEVIFTCSSVLDDGSIVEIIYDPKEEGTKFAVFKDGNVEYMKSINLPNGKILKPIPAERDIIKAGVVLFPARTEEYETEEELLKIIQGFIHKWVEIKPVCESIASYYVLFDWLYDCFNELPYLRALGEWGTGKTRFLKTVGSICYKPVFAGGAITSAPIFRILEEIQGTFIMDEGDFKISESWVDIVKILNTGYERGLPVLRCEGDKYEVKAFNVYGPKIIATRELFQDRALESRCLTIEMETKTRDDVLENLPNSFYEEATNIRNKMLLWRFRNYKKRPLDPALRERSIEPRLNQILIPLLSIVAEEEAKKKIKEFIKEYNQQLVSDRGMSLEADVVEIILKIIEKKNEPSMHTIADDLNTQYGYDEKDKRQLSARSVGSIVRQKLKLHPQRKAGKGFYVIPPQEYEKIYRLAQKFGVERSLETKTDKELQKEAEELTERYPQEFKQDGV